MISSSLLLPYVLTLGSSHIRNSFITNSTEQRFANSAIYACLVSAPGTGKSAICEYMLNLNNRIENNFPRATRPSMLRIVESNQLLAEVKEGPVVIGNLLFGT